MKYIRQILISATLFTLALIIPVYGHSACVEKILKPIDVNDDVAIDHRAGLIWQRCAVGTRWNTTMKQCKGKVRGVTHDEALAAARKAGLGWRVPDAKELASLLVNSCKGPKIDTRAFPDVNSFDFGEGANVWAANTAISPDTFYFVNFTDGSFDFHSEGFGLAVLLVRSKL